MSRRRPTPMCGFVQTFPFSLVRFIGLVSCGLVSCALGQEPTPQTPTHVNDQRNLMVNMLSYDTAPNTGVIVLNVHSEHSAAHLDRQALLKLVSLADHSYIWQTTEATSQGVFTNVPYGNYDVEINAVGYLGEHQELHVMDSHRPLAIDIVLHRDPSAVNLDVANAVMSSKARKQAKRAISLLKSNHLNEAQKQLDAAYKMAPSSAELNFLLGYLYFQKKDFTQAGNYLGTSATLNPSNGQALTLLGRSGLEREDYTAAKSALQLAVKVDADNWLPHHLLADTYLREREYENARNEAQIAIVKGREMAGPAQLVLGEALVGLGHDQEGVQALKTFLDQSPRHPMAEKIRTLIAEIKDHNNTFAATRNSEPSPDLHISAVDPLAALPAPDLFARFWQPLGIDDIKPVVAQAVSCPALDVVQKSGERVQEFVDDVARFAAVENLFHQALDSYGVPVRTETRKYNYVASISEPESGSLAVDEYRAEKSSLEGYPDHIASTGFAALALVFHPHMRDNFAMVCEGLGDWKGQPTWLVHFRQRDDRPNHMHSYKVGNEIRSVGLKGRAWITADKFQIVRIEAEMIRPMPAIQLLSEHQVVEYGPVPFPRKNTTLWLPKSAEIYFDFRKRRYYRRHSFDHYMLYSVDSEEKRKEPTTKPSREDGADEKKSF